MTYFLDRPDVMASYSVTLRADKARFPVLLSNGNLVEEGELPGGATSPSGSTPIRKPCYLFALVAGSLVSRNRRMSPPARARSTCCRSMCALATWRRPNTP
ncbi:MAG: hypothetical protein R3E42_18150 [Burkholderiaceae bacterium]